ncbi:MAG: GlxA family transcriptional regulator [Gammaproteobacteria bacterium]|nr:GlxA family transcriptional regulator [Gammaproteobacteria bacterium]NIR84523.1 GlxA family transcriptional regulator [Gammaproteobacteria bacterium]NIR90426.1 GlxA family transcriptional regulator [Gammaproteobacteria bacterium]NIU05574.1 GlxA family transcriptional regulator [Gammaproteobacteria bacterium]NIV52713.1 helix-turn-helix domain-containing protein [Gammaproteobacteria bacterium]
MIRRSSAEAPKHLAFLLIPHFAMMGFTAAVEPLRAANRLSGRELYVWRLYSTDGGPVEAGSGIPVVADEGLQPTTWPDAVLVCAGLDVESFDDRRALAWLHEQTGRGAAIGAISSGTYILARAGLLDGYRCTIHWENMPALREAFPHLEVTGSVYEIDRQRFTCSGGTAALDMMLSIVGVEHGVEFATAVSNQFIHDRVRTPGDEQRMAEQVRLRVKSPKLAAAINIMRANLESPLTPSEIAARTGISGRQLERLFRKYLKCAPRRYYLRLRVQHARILLIQTGMSILNVALASGFASQSYFTKCYREHFGRTPTEERDAVQ